MISQKIADLLKTYRKEKGLKQQEMADLLDVKLRTYQTFETIGEIAKADDLIALYKIFGAQIFADLAHPATKPGLEVEPVLETSLIALETFLLRHLSLIQHKPVEALQEELRKEKMKQMQSAGI